MARPRAFETEWVLKQCMTVFWTKGYKGTSLEDLMKATQLNKQSFYCAFGDKRSLFLKILNLYRKQGTEFLEAFFNQEGSPLDAIRQVLVSSIFRCDGDDRPAGCLYVSTLLEFGALDLEIVDEMNAMFHHIESLLVTTV
ncbi:MAG: TetR/AcrR family transcriptional regulator, partial [Cyanobacteria bacterium]|nr:TetR/AcrR family transcriptional regulator [Cyanobacteriota bacterium]